MTFIWSPDAIENLLQHRSAEVQRWAIDKSFELYPDQLCDRVLALIPSASAKTLWPILRRLAELELPISNLEPLVEATRSSADREIGALAGAILLRSGYALLPNEVEFASTTLCADVVGSTEHGFDLVLQAYRHFNGENQSFLNDVADICNFADLPRDLANAETKKGIRNRIAYFRQIWEGSNMGLEGFSRPEEILSTLGRSLARALPPESAPWKRGLLAELEHDRARLGALREIAGERISKWSIDERRFLQACILCLWRNETCWSRLVKATSLAEFWRALVMKPWKGVSGQALKDYLRSADPEELLHSLSAALRQEYSYGSYAFDILNALDAPGRFELFLDAYEGKKYGDILAEEAGEALRRAGAPAIESIVEHYPRMSQRLRTLILFVLDSSPTPEVVNFCLDHFDEYMRSSAPEEFVSCLNEIASSRFLPPLIQEWREGEAGIGGAIELISEINNIRDERIGRIIQDTEKRVRHPEDAMAKPISSFQLRCTSCGHTYGYELKHIYVGKGGIPVVGDIIQCKGCGSIETYKMTVHGQFGVTAELVRITALRQAQKEENPSSLDSPLKVYTRFDMTTLGRKVKSMGEAYHLLMSRIEQQPQDADLRRRMGNLLKNGNKSDLALPYYLEAIRLNSDDAESYYNIVDIFISQKRYMEAIPYLERLVRSSRDCEMDERLRRDIISALFHQAHIIEKETGHKVELFALARPEDIAKTGGPVVLDMRSLDPADPQDFEWLYHMFRYGRSPSHVRPDITLETSRTAEEPPRLPVVRANKVGRNDPCPCGSGKKYKKCCGR